MEEELAVRVYIRASASSGAPLQVKSPCPLSLLLCLVAMEGRVAAWDGASWRRGPRLSGAARFAVTWRAIPLLSPRSTRGVARARRTARMKGLAMLSVLTSAGSDGCRVRRGRRVAGASTSGVALASTSTFHVGAGKSTGSCRSKSGWRSLDP